MALGPYFNKAALSAAATIRGFDFQTFRSLLENKRVGVALDINAARSPEGRLTFSLLVDLCARFYSQLAIVELGEFTAVERQLILSAVSRAKSINPMISIVDPLEDVDACVVIGNALPSITSPICHIGSSGWVAEISRSGRVNLGCSSLAFGAGAAACLGAAQMFVDVFRDHMQEGDTGLVSASQSDDEVIRLSLLSLQLVDSATPDPPAVTSAIDISGAVLVGAGAIGNGAIWALANTGYVTGELVVVDPETVELSNLQRYVLTTLDDIGKPKVEVVARYVSSLCADLNISSQLGAWGTYVAQRSGQKFDRVLVALDSAEDRVAVQSSLPRWLINAWTQPQNLGVSRHPEFGEEACLACLYLPVGQRKSRDVLVAESVGAIGPQELLEVRTLLHDGRPVGEAFVKRTAERLGIPFEGIEQFSNRELADFYTEAVCGGLTISLGASHESAQTAEVPLAFQSTLAGILLASELFIDVGRSRSHVLPCRTELNVLRPLGAFLNVPTSRNSEGRCICSDEDFIRVYRGKYVEHTPV
jgi:hypothetical protein